MPSSMLLKIDSEAAQVQTAQNKTAALAAQQNASAYANAAALMLYAVQQSGGGSSGGTSSTINRQVQLTNVPSGHTFLHGGNATRFRAKLLINNLADPLVDIVPLVGGDGSIDPLRAKLIGPNNELFTGTADFLFETIAP